MSLLSKPPKHEDPLMIEFPNLDMTSAEWLKTNSLKGKSPEREEPKMQMTDWRHEPFGASWVVPQTPPFIFTAKKLSLYQVLAPNAFSPVEEYVPILRKTVSSTIHEVTQIQSSVQSFALELLCGVSFLKCSRNRGHETEPKEQELRAWSGMQAFHPGL